MLLEGVIDIFVDTRDTVVWRAAEMGVADRITLLDYDIKTSEYFVTLSKKSYRIAEPVQLLHGLDSCFAEMKKNGSYGKIAERYSIHEVPVQ
jgi:ABC-type amino acid transport substrate-binding protein